MLTEQTAIDRNGVHVIAGMPTGDVVRNGFGLVVMMIMTVVMVVVPMIVGHHVAMRMSRQMRVLAAGPGMDCLTEKLDHQIAGD